MPSRFPEANAPDEDFIDFKNKFFSEYNTYRCRRLEQMALNHHYYLGNQWIELDKDILFQGSRGFQFKEMQGPNNRFFPKPVTNKIDKAVELELSSLTKRQLVPKITPTSRDPRVEAAAKIGEEVLLDRLEKLSWPSVRHLAALHFILYGTAFIRSSWDFTWDDTSPRASPDAMQCSSPECETTLASPKVSRIEALGVQNLNTADKQEGSDEYNLNNCPTCEQPTPLAGLDASGMEPDSVDTLGRPMFTDFPRGNTAIEVVSPFDIYLENNGIKKDPISIKLIGQDTPRHLDWIEERYEGDFTPEDPQELIRTNPILGNWEILGRFSQTYDSNLFDCHARVYEMHCEKTRRHPQGLSVVIINDKVVSKEPLYKTVGQNEVALVTYAAERWKVRPEEFYGKAMVDDLISLQNRLNAMDSQITEARERLGDPNIMTTDSMDLEGPEYDEGGGGAIWRYKIDPLAPNAKPEYFGDKLFDTNVYQERQAVIDDIKEQSGPQDIEIGEAPKNVTTTSGLQLLGEAAERRRSERDRALTYMYEKIWTHQLEMLGCLRDDQDSYKRETGDGNWEEMQFTKESLMGQTNVKVEKQAQVDASVYQKEATREALADMLYDASTPAARRRILELRGLPTDVNEQANHQIDIAKKQWVDFVDTAKIPTIDPTLDDFGIHYDILGTFLVSEEGQRIADAVGWPAILKQIAGWEPELQQMVLQDAASRQTYGPPGPQAQQNFQQVQIAYSQAKTQERKLAKATAAVPGGAPPPGQLPPPPALFYLPPDKSDQVYQLWMQKIQQAMLQQQQQGQAPMDNGDPAKRDAFLRFRAVVDAYRLLAQEQMMKSMMAPVAGAPGSDPNSAPGGAGMQQPVVPNPPNPKNPAPVPIV